MNRRKLFKSIFGAIAGSVMAPVIKVLPKPPGDPRLPKVLIPIIRRISPELTTNELVGVQPMTGPVGLAFALRYKYTPKKWSLEWWKEKLRKYSNIKTYDKRKDFEQGQPTTKTRQIPT